MAGGGGGGIDGQLGDALALPEGRLLELFVEAYLPTRNGGVRLTHRPGQPRASRNDCGGVVKQSLQDVVNPRRPRQPPGRLWVQQLVVARHIDGRRGGAAGSGGRRG